MAITQAGLTGPLVAYAAFQAKESGTHTRVIDVRGATVHRAGVSGVSASTPRVSGVTSSQDA